MPDMNEKRQVAVIRPLIMVFIGISAVLAIIQYKSSLTFIAQLMGISWGALSGAFLAPFLYGLYWKKTTKAACWTCFLFGSGIMILNMAARNLFPAILQSPINCGAFAMLVGLVLVPVVSILTRKPDAKLVEDAFACYNVTVQTEQKITLGN